MYHDLQPNMLVFLVKEASTQVWFGSNNFVTWFDFWFLLVFDYALFSSLFQCLILIWFRSQSLSLSLYVLSIYLSVFSLNFDLGLYLCVRISLSFTCSLSLSLSCFILIWFFLIFICVLLCSLLLSLSVSHLNMYPVKSLLAKKHEPTGNPRVAKIAR